MTSRDLLVEHIRRIYGMATIDPDFEWPMGFCLAEGGVVNWSVNRGYICSCVGGRHEFALNDDGTVSPVERGNEPFWITNPELRASFYRFPADGMGRYIKE